MNHSIKAVVLLLTLATFPITNAIEAEERPMTPAEIEAEIWSKEFAIFEGRGRGDLSNYVDVISGGYLGWPPSSNAPVDGDVLKSMAESAAALDGEVTNIEKVGFTLMGDTALAYFLTHRTRLGKGFAEGDARNVNQFIENIHVWTFEQNEWRLVGGMARPTDGDRDTTSE